MAEDYLTCPECKAEISKRYCKSCSNCFVCSGCEIYICYYCKAKITIKPVKEYKPKNENG